ncbi:isopentenyl-diphosphate Delta-isomerase [Pilimelia columellifera]|uniref:isopentenyl-diphosphate Delta-isomerase n=1 Tax=Pilimelia columellifera subsp. columellifera TaxID=706583 RepID=A0ABN3MZB7_9ACTN
MNDREHHLVELVDDTGIAVGAATVADAHAAPGRAHRAFSVILRDGDRVLLQQRAAVKTRFPLRWANACCGHPTPGQTVTDAARDRLIEELGVTGVPLHEVGVYVYRAVDPATGRVEHEHDHVVVGDVAALNATPDPAEVAALRWVTLADLRADLERRPDEYAPWLAGVLGCLVEQPGGR